MRARSARSAAREARARVRPSGRNAAALDRLVDGGVDLRHEFFRLGAMDAGRAVRMGEERTATAQPPQVLKTERLAEFPADLRGARREIEMFGGGRRRPRFADELVFGVERRDRGGPHRVDSRRFGPSQARAFRRRERRRSGQLARPPIRSAPADARRRFRVGGDARQGTLRNYGSWRDQGEPASRPAAWSEYLNKIRIKAIANGRLPTRFGTIATVLTGN